MSTGIFLIERDGSLVELTEQPYDSEDRLQGLLANYPALLSGSEINPEAPRRWLLITREAGVPGEEGGGGRWSVVHLFLDQEGIPTLVEVKRSSDTRIRREVVGQMLDYAANGVIYWPLESLRAHFETRCAEEGRDPADVLGAFLGDDADPGAFWERVKTNLQAGRVRMLFVADVIPAELRRIVEFLNEQMDPAEVLAVEVRQFVSSELRTLVPRVYGRTEQAQSVKSSGTRAGRQWDEASFFTALKERAGEPSVAGARALLEWARSSQVDVLWGRGARDGSFILWKEYKTNPLWLLGCYTYGRCEIWFQHMKSSEPFKSTELREEFRRRLNGVAGIDLPADAIGRRPAFPLDPLSSPGRVKDLTEVLDWALEKRKRWEPQPATSEDAEGEVQR